MWYNKVGGADMRRTEAQLDQYAKDLFLGDSQRIAFRKAFPHTSKWKDETVDNHASKLFKTDEMQARLKALQDKFSQKIEESALLSASDVLNKIKDIIDRNEGEDDKTSLKGLELYGKHLKLFTDKIEHSGKIEMPVIKITK